MPQINGQEVGPTGFGLMGFTWRASPPPLEQSIAAMKAALEAGCNFWNGGEFYGPAEYNSLVLLEKYFERYPEDASKVVISIKGAVGPHGHQPDGSPAEIRRSIDGILRQLNGRKKLDIFECARRDPKTPMSVTFGCMQTEYIDRGLLGGISLSEVAASTIHEAVKVTKVVAVEVELSLWATEVLANGVAAACAEHNIPLVAYSPIGRGMLTGLYKKHSDIPADSSLHRYPRFSPENFDVNLQLVHQVEEIARRKKECTPAQLAISWTRCLSRRPGMPLIIPIPGATTVERVRENSRHVELTSGEMDEIDATLQKFEIKGERYPDYVPVNT
ncbi:NADP-dependent oxidoreductase domain-containing protein [Diplogelasinospora grovesii]|uniref:NADP-dependent oxidoreductase domain-containing protein n=1 Tax=Diplogelasinospora grovesii TaxID=303347 RepID=A0AAN6NAF6_9PEZI|nr:NADP-dependent oxidoreductase domain-containing protein [Diplogelasinospora grovesii]